jgi:hypothetical protein
LRDGRASQPLQRGQPPDESEAHPIDEQVERRLRHSTVRKRIIAVQSRVMAVLDEQRHIYLRLEELVGRRHGEREMSDEFFRTRMDHRFYESTLPKISDQLDRLNANIEALVAELRKQRRRAEKNDARDHAAAQEERHG